MSFFKLKIAKREAVAVSLLFMICFVEGVFGQTPKEKYKQAYDSTTVEKLNDIITTYRFRHSPKNYKIERAFIRDTRGAVDSVTLYNGYSEEKEITVNNFIIVTDSQQRTLVRGNISSVKIMELLGTVIVEIEFIKENCDNRCEFLEPFREYDAVVLDPVTRPRKDDNKYVIEKEYVRGFLDRIEDIRNSE